MVRTDLHDGAKHICCGFWLFGEFGRAARNKTLRRPFHGLKYAPYFMSYDGNESFPAARDGTHRNGIIYTCKHKQEDSAV